MSKHTPGPWTVEADKLGALHIVSDGYALAKMSITGYTRSEVDAQLIATAPEMFDELENALEEFRPKECNCDGEYTQDGIRGHACYFHRIEESIKRVLAKATKGK